MENQKKQYWWIAGALFVFVLFYSITVRTPLAGDDWGYAVNGMTSNPFVKAFEFYFSWSGRYFSELWGFIVAPRKWLWNILNPALFAGIYILMMKIVAPKRNALLVSLAGVMLMLTVTNRLRTQTYTWIMGTTYVVPLFLILLVIWFMKKILFEKKQIRGYHFAALALCNFYIGLTMENISAASILLNVLMLIYAYFKNKDAMKLTITGVAFSVIGFALIRLSPGASFRLARDFQDWTALGIFGQIQANWVNFLKFTFTNNKYMMLMLSLVNLSALLHYCTKRNWISRSEQAGVIIQTLILFIAVLASCAPTVVEKMGIEFFRLFYDLETGSGVVFCSIFYILYVINLFWVLWTLFVNEDFYEKMAILMLAGTCNLAMLLSPIFGTRSSLYTVYFIILLTLSVLSEVRISKPEYAVLFVFCGMMCVQRTLSWKNIYTQVAQIQKERDSILQYYREHPEDDEAWIPRMPDESIHSADIEDWDTYHQNSFKEYYELPDTTKLIFYNK